MKQVVIIGASGHGKVVADIVEKSGNIVRGFLDDKDSGEVFGYSILGQVCDYIKYASECEFVIAIGDNHVRENIANKLNKGRLFTAIHPTACIAKDAIIGKGTVVMANAIINSTAKIGNNCIINTGAIVEHDNFIDDYVHLSPKVALGGTVRVGKSTHIGIGATVINNITIADNCIIGAGAAVVNDILHGGTYVGVPARKI
ncbi:MAG TPA: acetyltransferase [Clostridiales bacterium]|nr:acetyltransferase [Clostridiales bacterium]